jgi:N-acetylated-alpha-linked acidic dipeptidase
MDMPVYPGDPTTPGYASTKDAKRLDLKDVQTIMKIPVIPISYADALPLLESMEGEAVPPSWRGGLPITYHVGPSKAPVHLQLAFNWDIKPLYNVVATLKGSEYPDEWVIRGNHHDGWVNGAEDPISGMVAEMEEARAIGELAKKGMRPKRTIMYCAWDGEEPALLGSTEWAEDNAKDLQKKAVIYINSDGNGRGFVGASGSHTLEPMFNEIIGDVIDPQTGVTVKQRRYAADLVNADRSRREKLLNDKTFKLGALGAGSDYSPFIQHLGIASMNLGYGGEDPAGVYHSIYDNYNHYTKFGDPGFQYGVTLAKTAGRLTLRMANADVLPLDLSSFTKTVSDYATEVKTLLDNTRTETEQENRMLRESIFKVAADPKKNHKLPKEKETVPYLNFSPLENSLAELKQKTEEFQKLYGNATSLTGEQRKQFNEVLMGIEQSLINEAGLPRRPWYKHEIYAPGFYTGYGVKTLPMIREAIEQRNWKEAQQGIDIVGTTIKAYTAEVEKASGMLKKTL